MGIDKSKKPTRRQQSGSAGEDYPTRAVSTERSTHLTNVRVNATAIGIDRDTPLRLADAIKIAFPKGGMTVSGLRRERDRNRLIVERIAGKEFTTLAHIERMRELCRVEAKVSGSNSDRRARQKRKSHTRSNLAYPRQRSGHRHRLRCR